SFSGERATVRVRKVDQHLSLQTDSRTTAGRSSGRGITSCVRRRCLVPRRNHAFAAVEGATAAGFRVAMLVPAARGLQRALSTAVLISRRAPMAQQERE